MKRSPLLRRQPRIKRSPAPLRFYGGALYDSRAEKSFAQELDLRQKAGDIKSWRRQVTFPLIVAGKLICTWRADFVVTHNDGNEEIVEVKGFQTEVWRIKEKLFRACYPFARLTVKRV